jgi:hypothetical protein
LKDIFQWALARPERALQGVHKPSEGILKSFEGPSTKHSTAFQYRASKCIHKAIDGLEKAFAMPAAGIGGASNRPSKGLHMAFKRTRKAFKDLTRPFVFKGLGKVFYSPFQVLQKAFASTL